MTKYAAKLFAPLLSAAHRVVRHKRTFSGVSPKMWNLLAQRFLLR